MINYFDNDSIPFIGSIVARLAGLALFVYAIHYAMSGGVMREMEIEARKRHKLQLYYEILCAIEDNMMHNDAVRHTRIQHSSRLSYD